ncbi:metallophosphoesterase family protein [Desulforamulus ruminis]|uniref:metallophosphoesterase family protein n=1 Tax=Desulforamulus ruminis TaxID=1564 RepID=UPI002356C69E|nr:metallophosphoesterase family protein [Desulforamulus ruminis]
MLIGVVADTHMPRKGKELPKMLLQGLEKVDMIIHAGDLTELWVLDQLSEIATVSAVAGNIDPPAVVEALGYKKVLEVEGRKIGVFHGHGNTGKTVERAFNAFSDADCIVFGHSHIPYCQRHQNILMFNPGSPTDKRRQPMYSYGLLMVGETVQGELIYFL